MIAPGGPAVDVAGRRPGPVDDACRPSPPCGRVTVDQADHVRGDPMELAVRPDDLGAAAAALRRLADDLDASARRFEAAAAQSLPMLGARAVPAADGAVRAAGAAVAGLGRDYLTAAGGLLRIGAAYADIDARLLRRAR